MKLSEVHQELLDSKYPKGYVVPEGEEGHVHVMFVDIVGGGKGKIGRRVAVYQKYFPTEWKKMLTVIENPVYGIKITGHEEYAIVHDPAEQGKANVKSGPKPKAPQK